MSGVALLAIGLAGCSSGILSGLESSPEESPGASQPEPASVHGDLVRTLQRRRLTSASVSDEGPATPPATCASVQLHPFNPQQPHPRIWLTPARLTRMRSQLTLNSAVWKGVLSAAAAQDGLIGAATSSLLYAVTGESSRADKARTGVLAYCASEDGFNVNDYREDAQDVALIFDWIYDRLSATERQTLIAWMNRATDNHWKHVINNGQSTDSDAITGGAKTALLMAIATAGDNPLAAGQRDDALKLWTDGALDWLGEKQSIQGTYINRSAGGLWMEGPSYGPNTMRYVFELAAAERDATGRDLLCEVWSATGRDFARDAVMIGRQLQLPGFTDGFTWSDIENPGWPMQTERWASMMTLPLERLAGSQTARWGQDFIDHGPTNVTGMVSALLGAIHAQYHIESHIAPFYQANAPEDSSATLPLVHVAPGPGVVIARTSNAEDATGVWLQPSSFHRVDHVHFDAGSFQMFRKGEWLTREVRGYGLWANLTRGHNSILLDGIGPEEDMRYVYGTAKMTTQCSSDDYVFAAGDLTAAMNVDPLRNPTGDAPADTAKEAIREFVFVRPWGWLVVFDRLEVSQLNQKKELIFHTMSKPTVAGNEIQSKSILGSNKTGGARQEGTQTLKIVTVLPTQGVTYAVVDEATYYNTPRPEMGVSSPAPDWEISAAERRWHVLAKLPGKTAREIALHVLLGLDAGQPAPTVSALQSGTGQGVRIVDSSGNGVEILFNDSGAVGGSLKRIVSGAPAAATSLSTCK